MKRIGFGMAVVLAVAICGHAEAGKERRIRFYGGVTGTLQGLSGDFDGDKFLTDGSQDIVLPDVDSAFAPGVIFGVRRDSAEKFDPGLELAYSQSKHDATWQGIDGDVKIRSFSAAVKGFFNNASSVEPFVTAGIVIPFVKVEDGAGDLTQVGDADFWGAGYILGGGISIPMGDRVAFSLGAVYRIVKFTTVDTPRGDRKIDDTVTSGDFIPSLSLLVYFN